MFGWSVDGGWPLSSWCWSPGQSGSPLTSAPARSTPLSFPSPTFSSVQAMAERGACRLRPPALLSAALMLFSLTSPAGACLSQSGKPLLAPLEIVSMLLEFSSGVVTCLFVWSCRKGAQRYKIYFNDMPTMLVQFQCLQINVHFLPNSICLRIDWVRVDGNWRQQAW